MNFIDRFEQKHPRFGVDGLMKYVIMVNVIGGIIGSVGDLTGVSLYFKYLGLDFYAIAHGQVWRLVTFVFYPSFSFGSMMSILLFAIWAFLYYQIGTTLENMWGRVRFNLFYISGVIFIVLAHLIYYLVMVYVPVGGTYLRDFQAAGAGYLLSGATTFEYLNQTLFLAFSLMFPDTKFLLYFIIPVKAKWLALITLVFMGYEFIEDILKFRQSMLPFFTAILILVALINYLIFHIFGRGRKVNGMAYKSTRMGKRFKRAARPKQMDKNGARHRCAICARTEIDSPELEFRYCSKCNGNYEYCSDHLFTHNHVK